MRRLIVVPAVRACGVAVFLFTAGSALSGCGAPSDSPTPANGDGGGDTTGGISTTGSTTGQTFSGGNGSTGTTSSGATPVFDPSQFGSSSTTGVNHSPTTGGGTGGSTGGTTGVNTCTPDTFANFAKGFFGTSCGGCHGLAWQILDNVKADTTISGYIQSRSMPQGSTLSTSDYNRILRWFSCGMPP